MTILRDDLILTAEKIFGMTETIDFPDFGLLDDGNELMCDCTGCSGTCIDGCDSGEDNSIWDWNNNLWSKMVR